MTVVRPEVWRPQREAYLGRVADWAADRTARAARGHKHPVYDFLFEYYSLRPAHLLRWTPGFGVALAGATRAEVPWPEFRLSETGLSLRAGAFPGRRLSYLKWAAEYLRAVLAREPSFACLGLHEWAMVYRDPNVRHPYVPLRLSRAETDAAVEAIRAAAAAESAGIRATAAAVAELDCYAALAQVASERRYTRPRFSADQYE